MPKRCPLRHPRERGGLVNDFGSVSVPCFACRGILSRASPSLFSERGERNEKGETLSPPVLSLSGVSALSFSGVSPVSTPFPAL